MEEQKIDISLGEELYERVREVARAEGLSIEAWLAHTVHTADLASKQDAMRVFVATYGEASLEDQQRAHEELVAAGVFDAPSPERKAARLAALARLRHGPMPVEGAEDDRAPARRAG